MGNQLPGIMRNVTFSPPLAELLINSEIIGEKSQPDKFQLGVPFSRKRKRKKRIENKSWYFLKHSTGALLSLDTKARE